MGLGCLRDVGLLPGDFAAAAASPAGGQAASLQAAGRPGG